MKKTIGKKNLSSGGFKKIKKIFLKSLFSHYKKKIFFTGSHEKYIDFVKKKLQ